MRLAYFYLNGTTVGEIKFPFGDYFSHTLCFFHREFLVWITVHR